MTTSADLRQHALEILQLAKKFLAEDGDLDPTAFIITADEQLLRAIELQDEDSKIESCQRIADEARQRNALAVITVFIARSKEFDHEDAVEESYSWGDLQRDDADRCILLTLSGPGIKTWAVEVFFESKEGKIVFTKQAEIADGVTLGFFPGWSEDIEPSKAS